MGRKFAKFRNERNLTREQVAAKIKEPVAAVKAAEANYKKARHLTVIRLCSLYKVSLEKEARYADNVNYSAVLSHELALLRYQKGQERLVRLRRKSKLGKEEIAKGAGISLGRLDKIETDLMNVAYLYIDKLCRFYGVDEKDYV